MSIHVGISGWRYPGWRGAFYPAGLPQRRELEFAARQFSTIELNGSFYSLQTPASYSHWRQQTPEDFVFSVKAPRFITHIKRLRDIDRPLANFLASGALLLGHKLGPMLWQLPPTMRFDRALLDDFFALLPRDTVQARDLARRRETARMRGRTALRIDGKQPIRHAVEVRHESFCTDAFIRLLRRHRVALVVADTAGRWPHLEDVTAGFVYIRLHGDVELYASGYSDVALDRWTAAIAAWSEGTEPADARRICDRPAPVRRSRDVYCYFDNDAKVRAPFDALSLAAKLSGGRLAGRNIAVTPAG